uniref:Uncharacterized protein MANES_18G059100 n=1 Tax=Rhizophora mucronata TaxID=61149 RepID=A0A2P2JYJ6_RHIMU
MAGQHFHRHPRFYHLLVLAAAAAGPQRTMEASNSETPAAVPLPRCFYLRSLGYQLQIPAERTPSSSNTLPSLAQAAALSVSTPRETPSGNSGTSNNNSGKP